MSRFFPSAVQLGGICALTIVFVAASRFADAEPTVVQQTSSSDAPRVRPRWATRLTGLLVARDGTRLQYSVLLPKKSGRFPVILNYSGYDPGWIGGRAYLDGDITMSATLDQTLVEHGFAVLGVNARGTACSEGAFEFVGPHYGQDGYDAVEFAARQPWSNGSVGMANWSWAGVSQLATALEHPPHLKAIAPGMVYFGDLRLDDAAPGGVSQPNFIFSWLNQYVVDRWKAAAKSAEADGNAPCVQRIAENLASIHASPLTSIMLQHPFRDGFIEERDLAARTSTINVPVLSMEAFQDEAVTSREGYYQETLNPNRLWIIQTNGPHDAYESTLFHKTLVEFLDKYVAGKDNNFERHPHVEVWMESQTSAKTGHPYFENITPRWTVEHSTFPIPVSPRTFNLSGGGKLSEVGSSGGQKEMYTYPKPGPSVNTEYYQNGWGPLPDDWRKSSLAYTSEPLTASLFAYGEASADLWISSTAVDTDIQVTITEVRTDGQEVYVQRGWLRASDRAIDANRSTEVRPVLIDRPEAITALQPDVPVLARVEINKFAYAFRAGSRVRIWIDTPSDTGEYGFDHISLAASNTIWHNQDHPSKLVLGVLNDVAVKGDRPSCNSILGQPCRPDPLASGPQSKK
jgi:uncharacterized protein